MLLAAGCAAPRGPEVLRIDGSRYGQAFDAALAAARRNSMAPELRDRRGGIIETQPVIMGSWLDPWRSGASLESTFSLERRRARFEFAPLQPGASGEAAEPPPDLSSYPGAVELRVWVVVDRAYSPGLRWDTWSKALTTRATITQPASDPSAPTQEFWQPLRRDPPMEQRLLSEVQQEISDSHRFPATSP